MNQSKIIYWFLGFRLAKKIRERKTYKRITASGLFDAQYYLQHNPDIAQAGIDPLWHYIQHGEAEGRNPAPWFDPNFYLMHYPDVKISEVNCFYHYIAYGKKEGRRPSESQSESNLLKLAYDRIDASGLFDSQYYLQNNPDIAKSGIDALWHYIQHGEAEGRNPVPWFDPNFYLEHYPDVKEAEVNSFDHYITYGKKEDRKPSENQSNSKLEKLAYARITASGLFDAQYYQQNNPDIAIDSIDTLRHYVEHGEAEGRNPAAWFDSEFYLKHYLDVKEAGVNCFDHYITYGKKEGRKPYRPMRRRNRILFLSSNDGAFGGSEDLWSQTAFRMRNQGYDVGVGVISRSPEPDAIKDLEEAGCNIIRRISPYNTKVVYESLLDYAPSLVVLSQGNAFEADDWMELFMEDGIPYVNIIHCVHEAVWAHLSDERLNRFNHLYNNSARVYFVSEATKRLTQKISGFIFNNYEIVRNPFKVDYNTKFEWPDEKRLRMALVGRLECFHKGHDLLLEVLRRKKWKERAIDFHIYGSGPHEKILKRLAKIWKIPNIHFEGFVSDINEVWSKNHACLQPSRLEGLPLSIVEAMLCGRMVVATDVGGNREVIEDGHNGLLAKAATAYHLNEVLEKAWQCRNDWVRMGEKAQKHIRQLVPVDPVQEFANRMKDVYDTIDRPPSSKVSAQFKGGSDGSSIRKKTKNGRILFISHEGALSGAPMILLYLIRWLKENTTWKFRIISRTGGPLVEEFGKYGESYCLAVDYFNHEMLDDVDLIYSNTCTNAELLASIQYGEIPVITHVHELNTTMKTCFNDNYELLKNQSSHFIACSNGVAQNLIDNVDVSKDKISVHYSSIPAEIVCRRAAEKSIYEVRESFGIGPDDFVVVSCGLAHWRKGADLLIRVAHCLRKVIGDSPKNIHFLWIGRIISQDVHFSYTHDIATLGLEETFRFVGEMDNPHPLVAASNVFCLPSREDPFPLVMLEAASLGKPGICFDKSGGGPEFYSKGGGIIVPYLDVQTMAEKLYKLMKNPELSFELGKSAKKIVNDWLDLPSILHGIANEISHFMPDGFKFDQVLANKNVVDEDVRISVNEASKIEGTSESRKEQFSSFNPLVSVIVPNYNYSHYLEKRLLTVFEQDYDNFEVIILDDCSTDESLKVIQRFENKPNVTVKVNEKNSGNVFKQWVRGIVMASGEIIWIAEADDLCEKSLLNTLVPYFQDHEVKLTYCNSQCIGGTGEILENFNYQDNYLKQLSPTKWLREYKQSGDAEVNDGLAIKNTIPNVSGVLFRKVDVTNSLTKIEEQITKYRFCGDWSFYLHLLSGGKICYTPDKLNYHRRHEVSVVSECHKAEDSARIMLTEFYAVHKLVLEKYRISKETFNKMVNFVYGDLKNCNFPSLDESELEKYYPVEELKNFFTVTLDRSIDRSMDSEALTM